MHIEDLLNLNMNAKLSARRAQASQAVAFTLPQIENAAAEGRASGKTEAYFTKSAAEPSQATLQFKAYMDKVTGRTPSAPKSPEEKLKELSEKLKKLQTRLSDTLSDKSLGDSAKSNQVAVLSAQIAQVQAQMSEVIKEMSQSAETDGA